MASQEAREHRTIETLASSYANYGERVLAGVRLCVGVVLTIRFFSVPGPWRGGSGPRAAVAIALLGATVAFSLWAAAHSRRGLFTAKTHILSAVLDVTLCAVTLVSTVLWPEVGYPGLLRKPDVAFPCIVVFAGALRLERRAVLTATAATIVAFLALARLDVVLNSPRAWYRPYDLEMIAILVAIAGALAWLSALAVQRALGHVAQEAATASRAQHHLREVLRDHHDVRTQLSSASVHLDLLLRGPVSDDVRAHLTAARHSVAAIADMAEGVRRRTFGELVESDGLASVELAPVVCDVMVSLRGRFPSVRIDGEAPAKISVTLFGGERGLVHVLVNLLVNACEGNGRRSATMVRLSAALDARRPGFVRIDITDDGPGFDAEILRAGANRGLSTKADGGGLGLGLVRGLVQASGGDVALENRGPDGGACVALWFRGRRMAAAAWSARRTPARNDPTA